MRESADAEGVRLVNLAGNVFEPNCPSRILLDHVTSRWAVLILIALLDGPMRWSELRRCIGGVTEKMLAQNLRTLEADGLVARVVLPEVPLRVDYSLTETGRELADLVQPLVDWVVAKAGAFE